MESPERQLAYHPSKRFQALGIAAFLVVAIAFFEWWIKPDLSVGFLYLFPILIASGHLNRTQIFAMAVLCTVLREAFGPFQFDATVVIRTFLGMFSFLGVGLFVGELVRRRKLAVQHLNQIEEQIRLRRAAEEELRVLVESSPAAIFTADASGRILLANDAARRLLAFDSQPLAGEMIGSYLPPLRGVLHPDETPRPVRTMLECRGRRRNGEIFLAHIWLSTYMTDSGPRLAAIVMDASEDLRDRQELGLRQLLASSRILVGAVSHEMRNLCAAIAVVHANLSRMPRLASNEDFKALGTLVQGLEKLAAPESHPTPEGRLARVDLREVLDELRIVIEPSAAEAGVTMEWQVPETLPLVWADYQGLLQVFMNLARNSLRALESSAQRDLRVAAGEEDGRVVVRFCDTGPGVAKPEALFRPFQEGADGAGLGLYVSRAMIRTFAGELRYEPRPEGCCFAVDLAPALPKETRRP